MGYTAFIGKCFRKIYDRLGISKELILSKDRSREVVLARMYLTHLLRENGFSFSYIGRIINREHTSVMHLFRKAENDARIQRFEVDKEPTRTSAIISANLKKMSQGIYSNIYELYDSKCAVCGFDEAVEVHHIIPKRLGGSDEPSNVIVLCPNHHALADRGMLKIKDINKGDELSPPPTTTNSSISS